MDFNKINVKSVMVDVRSCANMCPSTFCPLFHALHYSNALGKVYPKDRLHPKVILRFLTNSYYHKLTLVTTVYCFCFTMKKFHCFRGLLCHCKSFSVNIAIKSA